MENNDRLWVAEKMSVLDPPVDWHPNIPATRTRPTASIWYWAAAAALLAGAFLATPASRAVAQQMWQLLTVRRVAFIHVNEWPRGIPAPEAKITGKIIPPIPAKDLAQVRSRVQYEPRLPHPGVMSDSPKLSTTFGLAAGTTVHTADLERALRKVGVSGVTVPAQWDGAQVTLHTSAVVIAEWPQLMMAQSLPPTLTAPSGFDFPAFSAVVLRVLGVGPEEAQRLATMMGTAPAWLAPLDGNFDKVATIEAVQLSTGPATLVVEKERTSLFWSVTDRVYLISGTLPREVIIAAANAVQ